MNAREASSVDTPTVKVWDPLIRIFHWSLVVSFIGAYLLGEDGGALHQALGYVTIGLVVFRLVWGVVGTRYARFSNFVPSPGELKTYALQVFRGKETRRSGHNPAGGAMIVALLAAILATGVTGWMMTTDAMWGSKLVEGVHEFFATSVLVLVALHLLGVLYSSIRHRENLVTAMFTGRKRQE
jgi:cytochrome b